MKSTKQGSSLPPEVFLSSYDHTMAFEEDLHPEEQLLIDSSTAGKRRVEVTAGRLAARRSLELAGHTDPPPVGRNEENGSPLWPAGFVGSITHTQGVSLAAVSSATSTSGVGIDIEHATREMSAGAIEKICTSYELHQLSRDAALRRSQALSIFSLKESLYKALSSVVPTSLYFADVQVYLPSAEEKVRVEVLKKVSELQTATIRCGIEETAEFIFSWVTVCGANLRPIKVVEPRSIKPGRPTVAFRIRD